MPELRYNVAAGDWVIFATERAKRPHDFVKARKEEALPEHKENCPFCPGNESKTPGETFHIGDEKKWKVRVIPNLFGALSPKEKSWEKNEGMHLSKAGFGYHEVIVENPRHNTCIALMSDEEVLDIIRAYKSRYLAFEDMPDIESVLIFKNHGIGAGTSLEHPHSQLIASGFVPLMLKSRLHSAEAEFKRTGKCLFCRILEEELKAKVRVILESEYFVSFLPYAGISPFAIWIIPKKHASGFGLIGETEMKDLAGILKITLGKLYRGLSNPDFNYVIRSSPAREEHIGYTHWFLNIIPRISLPAGFELGSGMYINASLPEESAEFLRNA